MSLSVCQTRAMEGVSCPCACGEVLVPDALGSNADALRSNPALKARVRPQRALSQLRASVLVWQTGRMTIATL